jgi:hypothetical protein
LEISSAGTFIYWFITFTLQLGKASAQLFG